MTPTWAGLLTLGVLALAGAMPVLYLVGPRVVAFPLMPLAGAVTCGIAAIGTVAFFGSLAAWFAVLTLAAALAAAVGFARHPERAHGLVDAALAGLRAQTALAASVLVVAVAWTLRTLKVPSVGFDAQAIWILHARWLSQGHAFASAAIENHFLVLSHPAYPPLVSAVMALAWRVTGTSSDRVAVLTVALVNGCALFVAGWGIVQAGRRAVASVRWSRTARAGLTLWVVAVAALTVTVAGGLLGVFATNGYADPLWSLSAVGAVLFGLTLPAGGRSELATAGVLVAVAGLTKLEGTAVAMVLVLVLAARAVAGARRRRPRRVGRTVAAAAAALAGLAVWPLVTLALGVPKDPDISGVRQGSLGGRARQTFDSMGPHLHVLVLAAICAAVGALLCRSVRERIGLGNDLWMWVVMVGAGLVLGGAYVVGPGNVVLWLDTSVDRTTIVLALLGWWIVAVWVVCGGAGVLHAVHGRRGGTVVNDLAVVPPVPATSEEKVS